MPAIIQQIRSAVHEHGLFTRGDRILVCVSGGADSVALLAALRELAPALSITLAVAHLNHRIRGRAAAEDQSFVRDLASRFGLKFTTAKRDIPRMARLSGESLEMAGRRARYDFFARAARKLGCAAAATAHTADDQAETILLKLARGAGSDGLRGIPRLTAWKGLRIVRPLREVDRKTILAFLKTRKLAWREDASNRDTAFLRNKVRHEVIPFLESSLNPELRRALLRLGNIMEEECAWLESLAAQILAECSVAPDDDMGEIHFPARSSATGGSAVSMEIGTGGGKSAPYLSGKEVGRALRARRSWVEGEARGNAILCEPLASHPVAARRRILRLWLDAAGMPREFLDFETTERLDHLLSRGEKPRDLTLPGGWTIRREYGRLLAKAEPEQDSCKFEARLEIPGETILPVQRLKIIASIGHGFSRERPPGIGCCPAHASLSAASWRKRVLTVRSWRPGDRISPLGMNGSKKVQDVFTDARVPKRLRHSVPLFECGGKVIWLPGYRIARGWEVPNASARSLQLSVERM